MTILKLQTFQMTRTTLLKSELLQQLQHVPVAHLGALEGDALVGHGALEGVVGHQRAHDA